MLHYIYSYFKKRNIWLFLILSSIILIILQLYLQYAMIFNPCILCIYQRCALLGVTFSGIISIISPKSKIHRLIGIFIWIYSAFYGMLFSLKQINISLNSKIYTNCDIVYFPNWLPLDKWLPVLFSINSPCSKHKFQFLLNISEWTLIIFSIYFTLAIIALIAQFNCAKYR